MRYIALLPGVCNSRQIKTLTCNPAALFSFSKPFSFIFHAHIHVFITEQCFGSQVIHQYIKKNPPVFAGGF
jgi:hypothetical protein